MNFIWDKITEWLKGLLVSGIISNLSGLFDAINTRVGEAAAVVGTTPQAWHGGHLPDDSQPVGKRRCTDCRHYSDLHHVLRTDSDAY